MQSLSAQDVLHIWELGLAQPHPLDRALTILAAAYPMLSRADLARLSIGQRDARLLTVREALFGSRLECMTRCPSCTEYVEFNLSIDDIRLQSVVDGPDGMESVQPLDLLTVDGYELAYRLPNSLDLAAVAVNAADSASAALLLRQRCIVGVQYAGQDITLDELPESALKTFEQHVTKQDPQADLEFDLDCQNCGQHWSVGFDIAAFLWTELSAQARRLLREVHSLALAYSWREADILAMSAYRRQFYLDMVES